MKKRILMLSDVKTILDRVEKKFSRKKKNWNSEMLDFSKYKI